MSKKRKNLIFILTDDQGAWTLRANGNEDIKTPVIDNMVSNGINFSNFFCASPVCSPARASILTGGMPSYHGVCDWIADGNFNRKDYRVTRFNPYYGGEKNTIRYIEGKLCYTDILEKNGYDLALVGKWHLGDSVHPQHGFKRWTALPLGYSPYINPEIIEDGDIHHVTGYVTDVLTDRALDYIREMGENSKKSDKPFYLSLHYPAPHTPWGKLFHPDYVHDEYKGCEFKQIPFEKMHKNSIYTCESPYYGLSDFRNIEEGRKELLSGYYGAITQVDKGIGRVLDEVKKLGIDKDTVIVFTSDNGMNLGQHGIWGKGNGTYPQNMYDSSVKVPFVMYSPGFIPADKQKTGLYSQYDIFPTLVDLLDLKVDSNDKKVIDSLPGKSFLSSVMEDQEPEDKAVVIYSEYGKVRMLREKKYKYIHVFADGTEELYDLESDPMEKNNLAGDEKSAEILERFRSELDGWFDKYSDEGHSALLDDNYGNGQLCLNGKYGEGKKAFRKGACIGKDYYKFTKGKDRIYRLFAAPFMHVIKKFSVAKINRRKRNKVAGKK